MDTDDDPLADIWNWDEESTDQNDENTGDGQADSPSDSSQEVAPAQNDTDMDNQSSDANQPSDLSMESDLASSSPNSTSTDESTQADTIDQRSEPNSDVTSSNTVPSSDTNDSEPKAGPSDLESATDSTTLESGSGATTPQLGIDTNNDGAVDPHAGSPVSTESPPNKGGQDFISEDDLPTQTTSPPSQSSNPQATGTGGSTRQRQQSKRVWSKILPDSADETESESAQAKEDVGPPDTPSQVDVDILMEVDDLLSDLNDFAMQSAPAQTLLLGPRGDGRMARIFARCIDQTAETSRQPMYLGTDDALYDLNMLPGVALADSVGVIYMKATDSQQFEEQISDIERTKVIKSLTNLPKLGVMITHTLSKLDADTQPMLAVYSLSPAYNYNDPAKFYEFLNTLQNRLSKMEVPGIYHADPTQHDHKAIETLIETFDVAIEYVPGQGLTVR